MYFSLISFFPLLPVCADRSLNANAACHYCCACCSEQRARSQLMWNHWGKRSEVIHLTELPHFHFRFPPVVQSVLCFILTLQALFIYSSLDTVARHKHPVQQFFCLDSNAQSHSITGIDSAEERTTSLQSQAWCHLLWEGTLLGVRLKRLRVVETNPEKRGLHLAVCIYFHCPGHLCSADLHMPSAKSSPENGEL